jgi:hypothetical protein
MVVEWVNDAYGWGLHPGGPAQRCDTMHQDFRRQTDPENGHVIRHKTLDIINEHKDFFEKYPALGLFLRSYVGDLG